MCTVRFIQMRESVGRFEMLAMPPHFLLCLLLCLAFLLLSSPCFSCISPSLLLSGESRIIAEFRREWEDALGKCEINSAALKENGLFHGYRRDVDSERWRVYVCIHVYVLAAVASVIPTLRSILSREWNTAWTLGCSTSGSRNIFILITAFIHCRRCCAIRGRGGGSPTSRVSDAAHAVIKEEQNLSEIRRRRRHSQGRLIALVSGEFGEREIPRVSSGQPAPGVRHVSFPFLSFFLSPTSRPGSSRCSSTGLFIRTCD